jgi:hypothetical protein
LTFSQLLSSALSIIIITTKTTYKRWWWCACQILYARTCAMSNDVLFSKERENSFNSLLVTVVFGAGEESRPRNADGCSHQKSSSSLFFVVARCTRLVLLLLW